MSGDGAGGGGALAGGSPAAAGNGAAGGNTTAAGNGGAGGNGAAGNGAAGGRPDFGGAAARRPRGGPGMHGMGMPVEKSKDFGGTLKRFGGRLRPELAMISSAVGLAVVSVALSVAGPKILGRATNIVFDGVVGKQLPPGASKEQVVAGLRARGEGRLADMLSAMDVHPGVGVDFAAAGRVLGFAASLFLLGALLNWAQGYIMAGVTQRTVYRLREEVEAKLPRLPLRYFDGHARGDILSRVTNDIDNVAMTMQQALSQILVSLLSIVGVLVMMFSISPLLAAISLVTVPLFMVVGALIAKRSRKQFAAQWEWTGKLNGHVEEMHTGHALVKVFGHQQRAIDEFNEANAPLYESSFKAQFISGMIQPAMQLISNLNYVAICVIGGYRVASGTMSLGDVQAFIQYSRQFTMPIGQIASLVNLLQSGAASAERVFELLDAEEEPADTATPKRLGRVEGHVTFEQVSFSYAEDKPLIEDLSLEVRPGQTIAIVGPTGAGKTTLVNLLMRFYDVQGGRITLDGVDVRDLTRDDLRRCFGMVLQDTWLFSDTIRENIGYGAPGATEDEIREAARAAYVHHFVRTLPEGYDTVLDDEASNVSAGEKQLLTIARAFLADPPILILDEATSSVDTRTEVLIQQAMAKLRHGRTSFVIAHRLSTIRNADTILVMDAGRIVEQGTHEELLAKQGFYYDLYNSQFASAFVEEAA